MALKLNKIANCDVIVIVIQLINLCIVRILVVPILMKFLFFCDHVFLAVCFLCVQSVEFGSMIAFALWSKHKIGFS